MASDNHRAMIDLFGLMHYARASGLQVLDDLRVVNEGAEREYALMRFEHFVCQVKRTLHAVAGARVLRKYDFHDYASTLSSAFADALSAFAAFFARI